MAGGKILGAVSFFALLFISLMGGGPVRAADYTVTTLADNINAGSLRWAVTNAADNDRILFAQGLEGQITLLSDLPALNSVTFENAEGITLSRQNTTIAVALTVAVGKTLSGSLPNITDAEATGDDAFGVYSDGVMGFDSITGQISAKAGGDEAYGVGAGDNLAVNDVSGTVEAEAGGAGAYGLFAFGDLALNDITGSVEASAGSDDAFGLLSIGDLTVNDITGSVKALAGNDGAYGLGSLGGDIALNDITGSIEVTAGGDEAHGLVAGGDLTLNELSGTVNATAGGDFASGLWSGNMTVTDISGTVTAVTGGHTAIGLVAEGALSGPAGSTALISGGIEAKASGLAVAVAADDGMNLRVTGTLTATDTSGTANAYSIAAGTHDDAGNWVQGLAIDDIVVLGQGADITGKIDLGGGTNTLTLEDSGSLTGDVDNVTTLAKTGSGTWQTQGRISTQNLSVTSGNLTIDDDSTHTVSNALAISSGGTLTATVQQTGTPSVTADTLANNGEAKFVLGKLVPFGTTFDVVTTTAGISGTGELTSPLLDLTVTGNNIRAEKKNYSDLPLDTANAKTLAGVLNPYTATATGDMATLLTGLDTVSSVGEFNTCIEQLLSLAGPGDMTIESSRIFSFLAQDRMAGLRAQTRQVAKNTILNPDDPETWPLLASTGSLAGLFDRRPHDSPYGVFVKSLHRSGSRDSYQGYTGYDHDTMGLSAGLDRVFSESFLAGVSLGYAQNDLDYEDEGGSHANVDNLGAGLYGSLFSRQWYVDAHLSGTRSTSHVNRNIAFLNRTAQSDRDGYVLGGILDSGYRFSTHRMGISPLVSVAYRFFHQGGYTETGAGSANLAVDSMTGHSLKTGLGVKLDRTFNPDQRWTLIPEISGRWVHEFIDQDRDVEVSMAGMPGQIYNQELLGPKDDALRIRAGVTAFYERKLALLFHYIGEFEHGAESHGMSCELQYFF